MLSLPFLEGRTDLQGVAFSICSDLDGKHPTLPSLSCSNTRSLVAGCPRRLLNFFLIGGNGLLGGGEGLLALLPFLLLPLLVPPTQMAGGEETQSLALPVSMKDCLPSTCERNQSSRPKLCHSNENVASRAHGESACFQRLLSGICSCCGL